MFEFWKKVSEYYFQINYTKNHKTWWKLGELLKSYKAENILWWGVRGGGASVLHSTPSGWLKCPSKKYLKNISMRICSSLLNKNILFQRCFKRPKLHFTSIPLTYKWVSQICAGSLYFQSVPNTCVFENYQVLKRCQLLWTIINYYQSIFLKSFMKTLKEEKGYKNFDCVQFSVVSWKLYISIRKKINLNFRKRQHIVFS